MFIHDLGLKFKDQVTGFEGILVGRAEHLYGCNTYGIQPVIDKDGKKPKVLWFDEGRLIKTGEGINPENVKAVKNGAGDNPKERNSL